MLPVLGYPGRCLIIVTILAGTLSCAPVVENTPMTMAHLGSQVAFAEPETVLNPAGDPDSSYRSAHAGSGGSEPSLPLRPLL